MTLRVLTLSTLFPDATRPNFGVFVERQTRELASRDGLEVTVIAPIGLPPFPLRLHPRYRALAALPARESWRGLEVHRPHFLNLPGTGGRWHPSMMARALLPLVRRLHAAQPFDVIDASFFFPDGPVAAAAWRGARHSLLVKARGADIIIGDMRPQRRRWFWQRDARRPGCSRSARR